MALGCKLVESKDHAHPIVYIQCQLQHHKTLNAPEAPCVLVLLDERLELQAAAAGVFLLLKLTLVT